MDDRRISRNESEIAQLKLSSPIRVHGWFRSHERRIADTAQRRERIFAYTRENQRYQMHHAPCLLGRRFSIRLA